MINNSTEKELSLNTALPSNDNIASHLQNEAYSINTELEIISQEDLSNLNDISSNEPETLNQEDLLDFDDLLVALSNPNELVPSSQVVDQRYTEDLSNLNDISSNESEKLNQEALLDTPELSNFVSHELENENAASETLNQLTVDEYVDPSYDDVVLLEMQQAYADFGYTAEQGYEDYIAELSRQDDEHIAPISYYTDEF